MAQANMRPMVSLAPMTFRTFYGSLHSHNQHLDVSFGQDKDDSTRVSNILEDYVLLRLAPLFKKSMTLLADLMGRSEEAIKKRLQRLNWLSENLQKELMDDAVMIGALGVGINANTRGGVLVYRRITDPELFQFNRRLLKFSLLHKLLENLDISWFSNPSALIRNRPDPSQSTFCTQTDYLYDLAEKVNTSDAVVYKHTAYRINKIRKVNGQNCPQEVKNLIFDLAKIHNCSYSRLVRLVETLKAFIHACKVL
jgi:hypothetical protein